MLKLKCTGIMKVLIYYAPYWLSYYSPPRRVMCEFVTHYMRAINGGTAEGFQKWKLQVGSNMTGTDLCVNKSHCAAAVRPWEIEATTLLSLLLGLEPVQSCLGVARVMSNYGYQKKSVPVIFEPPCIYVFFDKKWKLFMCSLTPRVPAV